MDNSFQSMFHRRLAAHKLKPTQFTSVADGKKHRLDNKIRQSRGWRDSVFDNGRNLVSEPVSESLVSTISAAELKLQQRKERFQKWKAEKEKEKKEQALKKKKPFLFGLPHTPINKRILPPLRAEAMPSTRRVTRSQTGKLTTQKPVARPTTEFIVPKNAKFQPRLNCTAVPFLVTVTEPQGNSKDLPKPKTDLESSSKSNINFKPVENTASTRSARQNARIARNNTTISNTIVRDNITKSPKKLKKTTKTSQQSSASASAPNIQNGKNSQDSPILVVTKTPRKSTEQSVQGTPKNVVPRSESGSEEKLRSPKDLLQMTPQQFVEEVTRISPSVTLSRGKDNARKEMKKKLEEGLLVEYSSEDDSAQHYRRQLSAEISRMTALCDNWDNINENTSLPDFVQELILGACGMARLLMQSKMQQFADLVERCAAQDDERACAGAGAGRITPTDLDGFWDLLAIQIKNVEARFNELDQLRLREWSEEAPAAAVTAPARGRRRAARKPAAQTQSRLKEMIAAARRAAQQPSPAPLTPAPAEKSFEAGFFTVRSPVRATTPRSPRAPCTPRSGRASLLKCVLSSEANKSSASKNLASYAMLRASMLCKDTGIEGISPLQQTPKLPLIDLSATPARSILKVTQPDDVKNSGKKSIKVVLFENSDTDDAESSAVKHVDINTDGGSSAMEFDVHDEKENRRAHKLVRQDATDEATEIQTRLRRKTKTTPKAAAGEKKKSRKKVIQEADTNAEEVEKPVREESVTGEVAKARPRRSGRRSKVMQEAETNAQEVEEPMGKQSVTGEDAKARPRRSGRRSKVMQEAETNVQEVEEPMGKQSVTGEDAKARPRRSGRRSKVMQEAETNAEEVEELMGKQSDTGEVAKAMPKRSSRRSKVEENLIDFRTPPVDATRKRGKKSAEV